MQLKLKCISKSADDSGSRVVFALNPKTIQVQQGTALEGDIMGTIVFKDPQSADEFIHGNTYDIGISDAFAGKPGDNE